MTTRGREEARIDRGSPIPLYFQIAQRLRAELATTPVSSGPLYTEEELAHRFGVHRLTIRQALKELERDGLVYRQRGLGTFRAPPKLRGEPIYLDSFVDQWSLQGRRVRSEVIAFEDATADSRTATALQLADSAEVVHVERRRYVDDQMLVVDHIFLPAEIGRALTIDDLVAQTLHRAMRHRTGRVACDGVLELEATVAHDDEARVMGIAPGSPLFLRRLTLRDAQLHPLSYGWSLYRADLYSYSLTVPLPVDRAYAREEVSE